MTLDWSVFCKDTLTGEAAPRCLSFLFGMDPNADPTYLDWLISAWGWTIAVAGLSLVLAMVMGVVIGTMRTLPPQHLVDRLCIGAATAWVELFRNIPLLVQVFLWYHVVPAFFSHHEELSILSIGEYCFGLVYIRANCRASACGDPVTPSRAAECGHCIRHDHHTKLSLCIVTNGDAHHRSTTHIGVYEYCEELIRCICSVCAGTHFICFTGSGGNVARY